MDYEANRRVETSARTFAIIERMAGAEPLGVSTLADDLEISKGIVHNHLSTLRELGYVNKMDDGYELSPKFLRIGIETRSTAGLYRFAKGIAADFASRFGVGVVLGQCSETECTVVDAYGDSALDAGTAFPLADSLLGIVTLYQTGRGVPEATDSDFDGATSAFERDGHAVGPVSTDRPETCLAFPVLDETGTCRGSVGVFPGENSDPDALSGPVRTLRDRIESRFASGWTEERSFATEKHSWL